MTCTLCFQKQVSRSGIRDYISLITAGRDYLCMPHIHVYENIVLNCTLVIRYDTFLLLPDLFNPIILTKRYSNINCIMMTLFFSSPMGFMYFLYINALQWIMAVLHRRSVINLVFVTDVGSWRVVWIIKFIYDCKCIVLCIHLSYEKGSSKDNICSLCWRRLTKNNYCIRIENVFYGRFFPGMTENLPLRMA